MENINAPTNSSMGSAHSDAAASQNVARRRTSSTDSSLSSASSSAAGPAPAGLKRSESEKSLFAKSAEAGVAKLKRSESEQSLSSSALRQTKKAKVTQSITLGGDADSTHLSARQKKLKRLSLARDALSQAHQYLSESSNKEAFLLSVEALKLVRDMLTPPEPPILNFRENLFEWQRDSTARRVYDHEERPEWIEARQRLHNTPEAREVRRLQRLFDERARAFFDAVEEVRGAYNEDWDTGAYGRTTPLSYTSQLPPEMPREEKEAFRRLEREYEEVRDERADFVRPLVEPSPEEEWAFPSEDLSVAHRYYRLTPSHSNLWGDGLVGLRDLLRDIEPIEQLYIFGGDPLATLEAALGDLSNDISALEAEVESDVQAAQDPEEPDDGSEARSIGQSDARPDVRPNVAG